MEVGVAVVGHEADRVLPIAGILVQTVADGLVNHGLGFLDGAGRQSANGSITEVVDHVAALVVVEHAEIVVRTVALSLAHRVFRLVAQQEIVGRIVLPVAEHHAVVPCAVAKEDQVAGLILLALGPVVEHLHVAAVGVGIRRAARELIVELVSHDDVDAHAVVFAVQLGQPLGLAQEDAVRGHDDDEVGLLMGVQILIGHPPDHFGLWQRRRGQVGQRARLKASQRDIVEAHVVAPDFAQGHGGGVGQDVVDTEGPRVDHGLAVAVGVDLVDARLSALGTGGDVVDEDMAHLLAVDEHLHVAVVVVAHDDGQQARLAHGGQLIAALGVRDEEFCVEEVPAALEPAVVVDLVELMIVVGQRIVGLDEAQRIVDHSLVVVLAEEVVAVVGIVVTLAHFRDLVGPVHRSDAIEDAPPADDGRGQLLQVVVVGNIGGRQPFGLACTAVAVDLHLRGVVETGLLQQAVGQLVES